MLFSATCLFILKYAREDDALRVNASVLTPNESISINTSQVLPGLEIAVVEEAIRRSQTEDDGAISRWLLTIFS